jgi:pimeloyl-ACP methyl ester carboxylesterase
VRFCTASDGTRIAYASVGQGLPPLVKTANWLNHLEYDWESPVWSPLFQALAGEHQLVRYDARGNGLSDWDIPNLSFDAFVHDLETVVEAVGLKRFALLGISQGAAISIAYAVRHPERVSHLVLYGSFARGRKKRGSPTESANSDAIITLIRQGWGQENPAFRQLFTSLFIPEGTEEQRTWFNDLQRITTSPENAARLRQTVDDIEVTELLGRVKTPTLVLHCRGDAVQPFDEGRRLAAGIPGARFIALQGRNHIPLNGEPAWSRLVQEIHEFLRT